jgi:hypothetical protein
VPLRELCATLRAEDFDFVALTEHTRGVSAEKYANYVRACARESTEDFLALPGLEVLCTGGSEVAALGVTEYIEADEPTRVVRRTRELGGYALWVHPLKRGAWEGPLLDCDGVEILNGKLDGPLALNFDLLKRVRSRLRRGGCGHAVFGADQHYLGQPRSVWLECEVDELTAESLLNALRAGRFVSRTVGGRVHSSGSTSLRDYAGLAGLCAAHAVWNAALPVLPGAVRTLLYRASRSLVRTVKTA